MSHSSSKSTAHHRRQTTATAAWITVMNRELAVKVRDRAFLLSTVLSVLGIFGFTVFMVFMGDRTTTHTVGATDSRAEAVVEVARDSAPESDRVVLRSVSPEDVSDLLRDEEIDAALAHETDRWVLTGQSGVDATLDRLLAEAAQDETVARNAAAAGTSAEELEAGSDVVTRTLSDQPDRGLAATLLGFIFAMLFYIAAIVFGMTIANSVLEEKQNRVVEILATAIPVRHILYGKVAGNCILAFSQIILYASAGLLAANLLGDTPSLGWMLQASGWFIGFFVVGFAAQASIWAVLGSLASRTEDLQTNTGPIMTVLVGTLMIGIFAKGIWLTVASYVPLVSSVAMPVRMVTEDVAWWEPWTALGLCAVFGYIMFRVGERIYQRAVFQGGQALTWRKAFKLET